MDNRPMADSDRGPGWLLEKLRAGRIVLMDGATGTMLRRRGLPMSSNAWSALAAETHQPLLREIHADYIRAGAEVITTNTFATTRFVLEAAGAANRFRAINLSTVQAALEARDAAEADFPVAVAGAISCLPPNFDTCAYPREQAERDAYSELAELLAEAGVDFLALEMMEEPRHARLAAEAAFETGLPVWLGVSCRVAPGGGLVGFDFPDVPLARTLDALLDLGPAVVNVMHTPPDAVAPALSELASRWDGLRGACPELGLDRDTRAQAPPKHSTTPQHLAAQAAGWVAAGARLLGACCGSTPAHIRALNAVRDALLHE
jgi:S-methylmethionine-dependent homocysteine/selenocysteine methylase